MTATRRAQLCGLVMLAALLVGCGGSEHATDTGDSTVESSEPSTPTTLTARAQCTVLRTQDTTLRASEADIAKTLKAARAVEPRSPQSQALAAQLTMVKRELADVEALLKRVRAANGRSVCP